ncbi:MAG: glycosyltransferase [Bacteroidia bacterium]
MSTQGVSIIICCYNSARRIVPTLEHLQRQNVPSSIPWEVILVDNACTDNTVEISKQTWDTNAITRFKIVTENKPGLTAARICGAANSDYSYLSFIDDDNWISENWVQKVFEIFSNDARIGACGGRIEAVHETENVPEWFPEFGDSYATGVPYSHSGYLSAGACLWGAGISISKVAWEKLFHNNHSIRLTGRKGKLLTAGEDAEICMLLHLEGYRLWYDENLTLRHFVPKERLAESNLIRMHEGFGQAELTLRIYRSLFDKHIHIRNPWWLEYMATLKYALRVWLRRNSPGSFPLRRKTELSFLKGYLRQFLSFRGKYDQLRTEIIQPYRNKYVLPSAHSDRQAGQELFGSLQRERMSVFQTPVSIAEGKILSDKSPENGISIVVCCYNGEKTIQSCLESIRNQNAFGKFPAELIIVDNNPRETITRLIKDEWLPDQIPVRMVTEKREGLLHAKLKGYQEANYNLIAYLEDDTIITNNWLMTAYEHFSTHHQCGVLGGNNSPLYMIEPPVWMYHYIQQLAVGSQGKQIVEDITDTRGFLWGAGMVIRKVILDTAIANGFVFADNWKRDQLVSGVNTEFCWLARVSGYRLFYNQELQLTHVINAHRMSWINMQQLYRKLGRESISTDFFTHYFLNGKKSHPLILFARMYTGSLVRWHLSMFRYVFLSKGKVDNINFLMAWYYAGRMRELSIMNYAENRNQVMHLLNFVSKTGQLNKPKVEEVHAA